MSNHIPDSRLIKSIAATLEGFATDIREGVIRANAMAPVLEEAAGLLRAQAVLLESLSPPSDE